MARNTPGPLLRAKWQEATLLSFASAIQWLWETAAWLAALFLQMVISTLTSALNNTSSITKPSTMKILVLMFPSMGALAGSRFGPWTWALQTSIRMNTVIP